MKMKMICFFFKTLIFFRYISLHSESTDHINFTSTRRTLTLCVSGWVAWGVSPTITVTIINVLRNDIHNFNLRSTWKMNFHYDTTYQFSQVNDKKHTLFWVRASSVGALRSLPVTSTSCCISRHVGALVESSCFHLEKKYHFNFLMIKQRGYGRVCHRSRCHSEVMLTKQSGSSIHGIYLVIDWNSLRILNFFFTIINYNPEFVWMKHEKHTLFWIQAPSVRALGLLPAPPEICCWPGHTGTFWESLSFEISKWNRLSFLFSALGW